jgi:RNA polymerase sigma-70 factor (ECF subfamily)
MHLETTATFMNPHPAPRSFQTTRWSVVRQAIGSDDAAARIALSELCEAYWYPLYAYIRRSGCNPHDAEDLTQAFFARLLDKNTLAAADAERGRLRTFLLTCLQRFLADEHDRAMTQKRGGALQANLDAEWAEEQYAKEPVDNHSPDRLFQRRWALTVLEHALELLAEEYARRGKPELYEALRPCLGFGAAPEKQCHQIAAELGLPLGTVKNHIFRVRTRFREMLFEQVALTLDDPTPEQIKDELQELLGCV